jgi:hypothetical protein
VQSGNAATSITASSITGVPTTLAAGATATICFNATVTSGGSLNFWLLGTCQDGLETTTHPNQENSLLSSEPIPCLCDFCKQPKYVTGNPTISLTGTTLNINQPLSATVPPGVSVIASKAEIIDFARYVGDECMPCDKDATKWGNFINGTLGSITGGFASATTPVTGNTHHSIYFTGASTAPYNFNISTPPLSNLSCCCDRLVVSIRYTFIFKDKNGECKYCSQVLKYNYQRGSCGANPVDVNPNPTK